MTDSSHNKLIVLTIMASCLSQCVNIAGYCLTSLNYTYLYLLRCICSLLLKSVPSRRKWRPVIFTLHLQTSFEVGYHARIEKACVTLSYSRSRWMSALQSGSAQYKRWHSSIIKVYAETLHAYISCYTQHNYNFLAPFVGRCDALYFSTSITL